MSKTMRDPNMYYYLLRELSKETVKYIKETPASERGITSIDMREHDVVAVATRVKGNPLFQNWIYQMNSGIFIWVDPTDPKGDITIDTLTAFGVPDWSDEPFTQYTTVSVMYPITENKFISIQGAKRRDLPVG